MNTSAVDLSTLKCPVSVTVNGDKTTKVVIEEIVDY